MSHYQPGVCNLGKNEINKRYTAGVVGFGLTVILTAFLIYYKVYLPYSVAIDIIPLMVAFAGIYQGKNQFCVAFAARGIYNFEGTADEKGKVENADFHKLDLVKAKKINIQSLVSSLIVTAVIIVFVAIFF